MEPDLHASWDAAAEASAAALENLDHAWSRVKTSFAEQRRCAQKVFEGDV